MALSTKDVRPTMAVQTVADHWGITSFTVRTPQTGEAQQLEICAESWTGAPGPDRQNVTPLKMTIVNGPKEILPLLDAAGAVYEAAVAGGAERSAAMYAALRITLERAQQQAGMFPGDAT